MFAVERRRRTICIDIFQLAMPPHIARLLHVDLVTRAAKTNHAPNGRATKQRVIDIFLQWNNPAAPVSAVGSDKGDGATVGDSIANAVRAKPAEHHRMHRADAGTGQHRNGGFGNGREVNDDSIAFADLVTLQSIREMADFVMKLLVGERSLVAWLPLPENCCLVSARAG